MLSVTCKPHYKSVVMLNPVMLSAVMLSVIMLSVFMLSVVMLNVVAPFLKISRLVSCVYGFFTKNIKSVKKISKLKVTYNRKDTSLLRNMSIFHKLQIHNCL